jgi:hypothetical protein
MEKAKDAMSERCGRVGLVRDCPACADLRNHKYKPAAAVLEQEEEAPQVPAPVAPTPVDEDDQELGGRCLDGLESKV